MSKRDWCARARLGAGPLPPLLTPETMGSRRRSATHIRPSARTKQVCTINRAPQTVTLWGSLTAFGMKLSSSISSASIASRSCSPIPVLRFRRFQTYHNSSCFLRWCFDSRGTLLFSKFSCLFVHDQSSFHFSASNLCHCCDFLNFFR